jgi:hypothetical protein
MIVAMAGARGTTLPLQSGQCSPHPAPDPVARTNAPHALAATLYATTDQAKRSNARDGPTAAAQS